MWIRSSSSKACSEQLPGDLRAHHQDVLVPRGLLGAAGSSLQAIEGKQSAVLTEQVRLGAMGDHEAGHIRPWRAAPRT